MKTDRVVLDTNIFVSLILTRKLDELVVWSKDRNVTIYVCSELLEELEDVLGRSNIKKYLTAPVSSYLQFVRSVTRDITIDLRFDRTPDVDDNYLFDLAYSVKAYFLVTRDKPLLNMKHVGKIRVISLTEWKRLMK